ncbi:MAG: YegP family protein [Pseudomonadota bacterium]
MAGKFEIYKDKAGEFRFRLKAGNGQTILASEGYKERGGVDNGVESVKKNAADEARFEKKTSTSGKPYFVLKAANHQVIGNSEMYESDDARDNGIKSVMSNAPEASIDDQTA